MGHASSKEVRLEPQNPRRLSKPRTNSSSFNISQPKIGNSSKTNGPRQDNFLDESMFWKSPWTGDLLPKVTPETNLTNRNRVRSFPSFSALQPELQLSAQGSKRWSSIDDFTLVKHDSSLSRSGSYISRRLSRKSLNNIPKSGYQPEPRKMALRETRREPVVHFGPSDIGNHDHHSHIENLTTEEWSPIEDSCIPLSRRQSFRKPGIATRTPSWGLYRTQLSSIQQEDEKEHSSVIPAFRQSREPVYEAESQEEYTSVFSSDRRAASPVALDYSHLIGFKRGTLRIVNGSTSPVSSDRIRLLAASSITDDPPRSVYTKGNRDIFTSDANHDDEAIDVLDKNYYYKNASDDVCLEACEGPVSEAIDFARIKKTSSTANADSGYSSLSSVRSDNSSGQSSSPPIDSSLCNSPTISEGGSRKGGYFCNQSNEKCKINKSLIDRQGDNLGHHSTHLAGDSMAEQPRYYGNLGHVSIPSVPKNISIDDKESDSEGSYFETEGDGSLHDGKYSPVHSKSAMSSISRSLSESQSRLEYANQTAATIFHKAQKPSQTGGFVTYRDLTSDVPRGRARSRSIGHARKVPTLGKEYHF